MTPGRRKAAPATTIIPISREAMNMFKKCFLPADHMAPVVLFPVSRASLAMPIAPDVKNALTRAMARITRTKVAARTNREPSTLDRSSSGVADSRDCRSPEDPRTASNAATRGTTAMTENKRLSRKGTHRFRLLFQVLKPLPMMSTYVFHIIPPGPSRPDLPHGAAIL